MKQTGELLRKTREQKNLSLHEIGMSLKINPKTLQAIESADLSKLPQKAFVKGFVKSYAQFLKMDVSSVLELLAKEEGLLANENRPALPAESKQEVTAPAATSEHNVAQSSAPAQTSSPLHTRAVNPIEKPHPFLNSNSIAAFLIGLVLIASVILVSKLVSKYQKERGSEIAKQELIKSQDSATAATPSLDQPQPPIEGAVVSTPSTTSAVDPGLSVLNSGAQSKSSETSASVKSSDLSQANEVADKKSTAADKKKSADAAATSKAEKDKDKEKAKEKKEAKTGEKQDDKAASAEPIPTHPQEVIVEALKNVTIAYKLGSSKLETLDMAAGEIHAFKSKSLIDLDINDGSAINIIVNGRDRGTPSKQAKALHLVYPK